MHSIKSLVDDLASMGKPLDHEDLIDRVLDGLDSLYDLLIEQINSRDSPISFEELHEKLINKEIALQKLESSCLPTIPATTFTMQMGQHHSSQRFAPFRLPTNSDLGPETHAYSTFQARLRKSSVHASVLGPHKSQPRP